MEDSSSKLAEKNLQLVRDDLVYQRNRLKILHQLNDSFLQKVFGVKECCVVLKRLSVKLENFSRYFHFDDIFTFYTFKDAQIKLLLGPLEEADLNMEMVS